MKQCSAKLYTTCQQKISDWLLVTHYSLTYYVKPYPHRQHVNLNSQSRDIVKFLYKNLENRHDWLPNYQPSHTGYLHNGADNWANGHCKSTTVQNFTR